MTHTRGVIRGGFLLVLIAIFLAAGIAVDLGLTQPVRKEFVRLSAQRDTLMARSAIALERKEDREKLARQLKVKDLSELVTQKPQSDPLNYLGQAIEASGLERLDLSSGQVSTTKFLRRSDFTLRLMGSYRSLIRFVRYLEQGPRLASIDAFEIQELPDSKELECRLHLSIHDPLTRQAP